MSLASAKKLLTAGARLREPVIMTMTAASFEGVVPVGARNCEIMCVGAGFDGLYDDGAYQTASGRDAYGSPGGQGGGAIPRTTIKVSSNARIAGKVGQTNGQPSTVTIGSRSFTTQGLVGGAGGLGGYVSIEPGQAGRQGVGDEGPGGGGGNWGANAPGGNGANNSMTGAYGGGGGVANANDDRAGSPRVASDGSRGAAGQAPGGGGGGGSTTGKVAAGRGARGEVRLTFT